MGSKVKVRLLVEEAGRLKNNMLAQNLDAIQKLGLPQNKIPATPGELISLVLPYIFYGAGIALLIYLVMGGLQLMTSRGDPKAMQMAQAKITNAFVGFIIVIFSVIIVSVLGHIFGIQSFVLIFK